MQLNAIKFVMLGFLLAVAAGCTSAASQPIPDGVYTDSGGVVELSLVKGNWFINHGPFKHVEEGTYLFSGNQIQFNLVKRDPIDECNAAETSFAYHWSLAGKSMTLTKLDDNCGIRTSDLAGGPLSLKGTGQ